MAMIKLSFIVPFYKGIRKLTRLVSYKQLTGKIYIYKKTRGSLYKKAEHH